jgi:YD repeat-containing protein
MKNITVIIDRVSGSNIPTAKAEIEEVLEALKPLRERGLRVRVCRSHLTLKEDKPWRAKAAGAAVFALALVVLAAVADPAAAQNQTTFRDASGRTTGTVTTDSNGTKTFRDASGRTTGTATTNSNGTTTFRDASGRTTGTVTRSGR